MENKTIILWITGGAIALVAITVVISVTIINPSIEDKEANPSGIVVPSQDDLAARDRVCASLQEKIDAEGRPGWEGLSDSLRAEIEASGADCTLQGNGKRF